VGEVPDHRRWRFTGVYGFPKVEDRFRTWDLLKALGVTNCFPWLLCGDFNEILCRDEKMGGGATLV
jgi:hypothetical protein